MKLYSFVFLALIFIYGCNQQQTGYRQLSPDVRAKLMDSLKAELLKTDLAFSQLSEQKGRNAAFLEYADSSATMLRPYSMPLTGKDSILVMLSAHPDTSITLTWIPVYADISRACDLGYTYGTYYIETKNLDKAGGTYCTIWKRNRQTNKWKFVLSTGNEGLQKD